MSDIPNGVYSETLIQSIGTMSTARKQQVVNYYFCKQLDPQTISVQILDIYGDPLPLVEKISLADFLKRFKYEPDKFKTKKTAADLAVDKAIAQAEQHVKRKEFFSAEFEYTKALKLDEANVRANFGLGKIYMTTGETEKAIDIFGRLSQAEAILEPDNKHIFNELGMELRLLKLYDEAIEFYQRALAIANDDENLCFNVARAAIEKNDLALAREYLNKALQLNPNMTQAATLLSNL